MRVLFPESHGRQLAEALLAPLVVVVADEPLDLPRYVCPRDPLPIDSGLPELGVQGLGLDDAVEGFHGGVVIA